MSNSVAPTSAHPSQGLAATAVMPNPRPPVIPALARYPHQSPTPNTRTVEHPTPQHMMAPPAVLQPPLMKPLAWPTWQTDRPRPLSAGGRASAGPSLLFPPRNLDIRPSLFKLKIKRSTHSF
eukprot:GEMP01050337.1.p3 GENE.GEMP01050337.1~~GEMP01050337.1.p3  ORF type:complete len:122 (+),score=23.00 GEMP01050337.1:2-367(+)